MSIPERFYRIAKHKLGELKEQFDKWDEEAQDETDRKRGQEQVRRTAREELEDAMTSPSPDLPTRGSGSAVPVQPPPARRTPEEIARGSRPNMPGSAPPPTYSGSNAAPANDTSQSDPLLFHYRLLGVDPGSDFTSVKGAYNKLAARSDPSRFPAGSDEEKTARTIRERLDASYKVLRDALDPTALRFDRLEFDTPVPPAEGKV